MFIDRKDVGETNRLVDGLSYHKDRYNQEGGVETVYWTIEGLEITRLRLISDPGYSMWEVSYCHGILNGKHVDVNLPFSKLPKRNMKKALYNEANRTGCFIKGLFSSISTLC